jgi:hypothetical protein
LSKLEKAYLSQGHKKFESIVAVEMTIKKAMSFPAPRGCDEWEIFLDMDDVWGLYKVWQKDPIFQLYIEYSAKDANGKPLMETICGEVRVTDIASNSQSSTGRPHMVRGTSRALKMSSKDKFIKEKVQFT